MRAGPARTAAGLCSAMTLPRPAAAALAGRAGTGPPEGPVTAWIAHVSRPGHIIRHDDAIRRRVRMIETHADLHRALDDALRKSAPLAWKHAPDLCPGEGVVQCHAYHRVWQYLLLLKVVSSLRTDTAFMIEQLRIRLVDHPRSRILISGAAEYGMLAHVLWAARLARTAPPIVVLDQCATPLMLNRWYAERAGAMIETVQADVLKFDAAESFDIICTHSFLGWFCPADKQRLLTRWRNNLKPGGVVVTTQRLRPSDGHDITRTFDAAESAARREQVRAAAVAQGFSAMAGIIADAAYEHFRTNVLYRTATPEELEDQFASNGLPIVLIDQGRGIEPGTDRPSGPVKGAGLRVRLVAQRPMEA